MVMSVCKLLQTRLSTTRQVVHWYLTVFYYLNTSAAFRAVISNKKLSTIDGPNFGRSM